MNNDKIIYSPLSISTITICFNFNQIFSLDSLKQKLNNDVIIKFNPGSKKSKNPKKKGTDFFYNSFDIRLKIFHNGSIVNISVFIFPNSKVKIAGIKSIEMIDIIIDQLIELIADYLPFEEELKAENVKIQMICSDFKIKPVKENNTGWCIKQDLLKKILVNNYNISATFSPLSRYPGINVKKKSLIENNKPVSLLIFRSGSIIITGAKDIIDIHDSYNFIVNIIRIHSNELFYYDINEEIKQQKKIKKN
jgi:TATA-box binding protein (TBP) (component of TFIID and TFIIIB)